MRTLLLVPVLLALIPAAAPAQDTRPCSVEAVDSTSIGVVYRDCDVDRPASLRRDWRPQTYAFPGNLSCLKAELVFVVDSTGVPVPATAAIVETNVPRFAQDIIESLRDWRYRPAQRQGVPVRQVVRARVYFSRDNSRVPFTVGGPGAPPPAASPTHAVLFTPCN